MLSVQACLPALARSGRGRVIVISSITGPITGCPGWTAYGASKAAQLGFMRTAAITFFLVLDALASSYTVLDYPLHGGRLPAGWLAVLLASSWAPAIVLSGAGHHAVPGRADGASWWKPMLWAYVAVGAAWQGGAFAISLGAVISHHDRIDASGDLYNLDDPGGSDAWWGTVQAVFFPAVAVCWLVWLGGQVLSYRRSSKERRLQLRWLRSGAARRSSSRPVSPWCG